MIYGIYNKSYPSVSFNPSHCQIRSYIVHVFICAFYYSCAFQSIFRLFRIAFPKRKTFESRFTLLISIFLQWAIPILYIYVYLALNSFEYHPSIGSCWISFTNVEALSTVLIFIYGIPLTIMIFSYIFIIQYIQSAVKSRNKRRRSNRRDVIVIKRILILVLIAMAIGIPTVSLLAIYIVEDYLSSLAYHIQVLGLTLGLLFESIALIFITPQIRNIFQNYGKLTMTSSITTNQEQNVEQVSRINFS